MDQTIDQIKHGGDSIDSRNKSEPMAECQEHDPLVGVLAVPCVVHDSHVLDECDECGEAGGSVVSVSPGGRGAGVLSVRGVSSVLGIVVSSLGLARKLIALSISLSLSQVNTLLFYL